MGGDIVWTGLDHVQLAMPRGGEAAARAFFIDLLGWREIAKPEALRARGGLWLEAGAAEIHLGVEDAFSPARKAHPAFAVNGIDQLARRLDDAGHAVTWADDIPGRRRFFSADPFGNRLEFLEG
jgi:catechol 2,3-dioxygenase-like lactoylglutathione lyase family enzyme